MQSKAQGKREEGTPCPIETSARLTVKKKTLFISTRWERSGYKTRGVSMHSWIFEPRNNWTCRLNRRKVMINIPGGKHHRAKRINPKKVRKGDLFRNFQENENHDGCSWTIFGGIVHGGLLGGTPACSFALDHMQDTSPSLTPLGIARLVLGIPRILSLLRVTGLDIRTSDSI